MYKIFRLRIREGLKSILAISRLGNGFIQATKPWELVKKSSNDKWLENVPGKYVLVLLVIIDLALERLLEWL